MALISRLRYWVAKDDRFPQGTQLPVTMQWDSEWRDRQDVLAFGFGNSAPASDYGNIGCANHISERSVPPTLTGSWEQRRTVGARAQGGKFVQATLCHFIRLFIGSITPLPLVIQVYHLAFDTRVLVYEPDFDRRTRSSRRRLVTIWYPLI